MQAIDFTSQSPGALVQTSPGILAFVPAPLPESLLLDSGTTHALLLAERALGQLTGTLRVAARGVSSFLISSPLTRREAISSSRIEGTLTTPEQLALFEIEPAKHPPADEAERQTKEVLNYVRALEHGFSRLDEIPICQRLIKELHAVLMEGVRGGDETPGEFRTVQNFIGSSHDIREARFVPPPPEALRECLTDFERSIHTESNQLPALVRLALLHYQFETIHPFRDGNGRVGRLLLPLLLHTYEKIEGPVLYISSYLEQHRRRYTDLLLQVSQTGDYLSWVRFFLEAVTESAKESVDRAEALLALRDESRRRLQSARSSSLLLKLVDAFFERPSMSIGATAKLLQVTDASAAANLRKLQELGFVVEVTGRRRDQRYVARQLIEVVYGPGNRT
jgi:Fic family protein